MDISDASDPRAGAVDQTQLEDADMGRRPLLLVDASAGWLEVPAVVYGHRAGSSNELACMSAAERAVRFVEREGG